MKGRDSSKGAPSADLLVCFPTRAHLTLLPKPICSPARHPDSAKRHHHKKSGAGGRGISGPGLASPLLWVKNSKQMGPESSEPTSPKVTCAGQIKVRPTRSANACRNWQSVMEEIERIHTHEKQRKSRSTWGEAFGFKKEVMQFLTCLRSIKFDFRCFGAFPEQGITSDDDDDEEEERREDGVEEDSGTVFSKWFMVLQENQEGGLNRKKRDDDDDDDDEAVAVPPANALLLMRCRSAPAQSRVKQGGDEDDGEQQQMKIKKKRESLEMVMKYDTDFNSEVVDETWVVGDPFSRSKSWKR